MLPLLALTLMTFFSTGLVTGVQAAPIELSAKLDEVDLVTTGEYLIDSSGKLTAANIAANSSTPWQKGPVRGIYPLLPGQALWLRFSVLQLLDDKHWSLEIPYAALNRAERSN